MKILITGATGFVGKKVLKHLLNQFKNDQIIALSSDKIEGIKTIDACGYQFGPHYLWENGAEDVEVLLHIGAFIPKTSGAADCLPLTTRNITSTQCLLDSYIPTLRKIVFISTLDVYEDCKKIINEDAKVQPQTMYGWSKLYCEQMVQAFCRKTGCIFEILRLGHVYGEGEEKYRKAMPVMIRNAIEGRDLTIYGDGMAIRSFVYIDDVAEAIVNSLTLKESDIINIVGDEPVTINRLAEMIKDISERDIKIRHISTEVANRDYLFDNGRMRRLLLRELTPFEEGLRREYNYMVRESKG